MEYLITAIIGVLVGLSASLMFQTKRLTRVIKEQNKVIKILQSDSPIFHDLQLKYSSKQ